MEAENDRNCQDCNEKDEVDDMVSCDRCHKWWHFRCAEVLPNIADMDWICIACKAKDKPPASKDCEIRLLRKCVENLNVTVQDLKASVDLPKAAPANNFTETSSNLIASASISAALASNSTATRGDLADEKGSGTIPKSTNRQGANRYALLKTLPCKSMEELDRFLEKLEESELNYNGLVSFIQSSFRKDLQKSIKGALDMIIDKNVQKKLSWSGLRTTKPSIEKKYKLIVSAIDEALKGKFNDYDYNMLSDKIQTLLQGA